MDGLFRPPSPPGVDRRDRCYPQVPRPCAARPGGEPGGPRSGRVPAGSLDWSGGVRAWPGDRRGPGGRMVAVVPRRRCRRSSCRGCGPPETREEVHARQRRGRAHRLDHDLSNLKLDEVR